jgi:hypothetical protein
LYEFNADHCPGLSDITDSFKSVLQHLQALIEPAADVCSCRCEIFFLNDIQYREGRCHDDRVASKRVFMRVEFPLQQAGPRDGGAHGETGRDGFGEAQNIRRDAKVIACKQLTSLAKAGLYFVHHEQDASFPANALEALQECLWRNDVPAGTLDRLDNNSRTIFDWHHFLQDPFLKVAQAF